MTPSLFVVAVPVFYMVSVVRVLAPSTLARNRRLARWLGLGLGLSVDALVAAGAVAGLVSLDWSGYFGVRAAAFAVCGFTLLYWARQVPHAAEPERANGSVSPAPWVTAMALLGAAIGTSPFVSALTGALLDPGPYGVIGAVSGAVVGWASARFVGRFLTRRRLAIGAAGLALSALSNAYRIAQYGCVPFPHRMTVSIPHWMGDAGASGLGSLPASLAQLAGFRPDASGEQLIAVFVVAALASIAIPLGTPRSPSGRLSRPAG